MSKGRREVGPAVEEALRAVERRFPNWAPSALMQGFARAVAREAVLRSHGDHELPL